MVSNELYIGNAAQLEKKVVSYRDKREIFRPTDEQIRIDGAFPAIIDRDTWEAVQAVNRKGSERMRNKKPPEKRLFSDILVCADCGAKMVSIRRSQTGKKHGTEYVSYLCGRYHATAGAECSRHNVSQHTLGLLIVDRLRQMIDAVKLNEKAGAVLGEIAAKGIPFDTTISKTTLYRYIDENLFLNLTNKDLPQGKRSGKRYGRVRRISYKHMENKSIEQRPAVNRDAFGHWEMDTVVGKAQGKSTCLFVLTERMMCLEVIVKMLQRSSACMVKAIDQLEKRHKEYFPQVFKTITVDNGSEFMDCKGIERDGRTQVYYCHPFSSWERGSNENANKLIRRFIPKGTRLDKYTKAEIQRIEHWMNNYLGKILNYKTSVDVFNEEIQKLIA